MKTVAIVVLYNPDSEFIERCKIISSQVDELLVYDNSENPDVINSNSNVCTSIENLLYISEAENKGIAYALNYGIKYAEDKDADYVITFDQDTKISNDYVLKMLPAVQSDSKIGALGPVYLDVNANRRCRFPVKKFGFVVRDTLVDKVGLVDVMAIISSGTIFPISIFKSIGYFKDEYFIDYVDNEYCLRLIKNGFRVCVNTDVVIDHALGERTNKKLLVNFSPTNYPYYRKYYITRNRFFVYRDYLFSFPGFIAYDLLAFCLDFFRVIVFENNKKIKLKAYWNGFKDFTLRKSGKIDNAKY